MGSVRASGRPWRVAGVVALAGVVLWTPAHAGLADSPESADTVAFSGGCGLLNTGLGASSNPDAPEVTVPEGGELAFTNQLGQPATLRLNGEAATEVAPDDTATVVFHDGPVTAAMQINCLLGEPAGEVRVEVGPAAEPRPSASDPAGEPAPSASDPEPARSRPAPPAAEQEPNRASSDIAGSDVPRAAAVDPYAPMPAPPAPRAAPYQDPPPASASERPDDPRSPEEGDELGLQWGDPADGGGSPGEIATEGGTPDDGVAAEQVSRTGGSMPEDGLVGLLALLATVCVAGVSAGAVRAILAERTRRTAAA